MQGRNEGGQEGHNSPGAESLWGAESLRGAQSRWVPKAPKSPNNVTNTFFNTLHLLPKDLRFKHGGACFFPWRHLTSLSP